MEIEMKQGRIKFTGPWAARVKTAMYFIAFGVVLLFPWNSGAEMTFRDTGCDDSGGDNAKKLRDMTDSDFDEAHRIA